MIKDSSRVKKRMKHKCQVTLNSSDTAEKNISQPNTLAERVGCLIL